MKNLTYQQLKHSGTVRGRLRHGVIRERRETIYRMLEKRNMGKVPCFVCGQHVERKDATLEHILERRNGGTDKMENLSISHKYCNQNRCKIEHFKGQT